MWKDSFSLGIPAMDIEHKKLVGYIAKVKDLIGDAEEGIDCYDELASVLEDLKSYTREHFRDEEALMMLKGFTGIDAHRALHEGFEEKVHDLLDDDFDHHQLEVLEEVVQMLLDWLVEHILTEDKKYLAVMM